MSLQVWLPLNGDLSNNGLSNYQIGMFRGSETYVADGKIGQCFNSNGTNTIKIYNIIPDFYNYQEYSLCAWFYIVGQNTSHSGSAVISAGDWNHDLLNLSLSNWSTDHYTQLRITGPNWDRYYSYNFLKNTWYHVIVSSDRVKTYAYVNGELLGGSIPGYLPTSISGNDICIGGATYYSGMQFYGKINDVRIYDHCLSQKEIKEISKALVLHYTLDNGGFGNENLLSGVLDGKAIITSVAERSAKQWCNRSGGNATVSVAADNTAYIGGYVYKIVGNTFGNKDIAQYDSNLFALTNDEYYTMSAYYRGSGTYLLRVWNYTKSVQYVAKTGTFNTNGKWQLFYNTFLANEYMVTDNIGFLFGITGNGTTDICGMKVEKGNSVTPWTPSIYDEAFHSGTTIYDSSGYRRNGILNGNRLIWSNNSARYSASATFDGVDNSIIIPYNAACPSNIFTMNLWFYKSSLGSKNYETLVGGPSGFEMDTRASASTSLSLYMASTRGGNVFSPFEFNKWYMVTMVRDGTNEMYYVNGELKKTIEAKAMPTGTYYIGSWASANKQNFKGLISDFRLYNSVLSADEIYELYSVSASTDRNNNIYSYCFQEIES